MEGWIKLYRKLMESKYGKDLEMVGFFAHMLMRANHKDGFTHDGTKILAGQFMTSQEKLASEFRLTRPKIQRMLAKLKDAKQIDLQTSPKNTIITILNWQLYQSDDQPAINQRAATVQLPCTNKNANNNKNGRKKNAPTLFEVEPPTLDEDLEASSDETFILTMLNSICFRAFRPTKFNLDFIRARLKEKYTLEDFRDVIEYKNSEWGHKKEWKHLLQPSTLFGNKFDQYLNQAHASKTLSKGEEDALIAQFFPGA